MNTDQKTTLYGILAAASGLVSALTKGKLIIPDAVLQSLTALLLALWAWHCNKEDKRVLK